MREKYAEQAQQVIPLILWMVDKGEFSSTYGCFDFQYWDKKAVARPRMSFQELSLPLAMAYKYPLPGGAYFQRSYLRRLIVASLRFAMSAAAQRKFSDESPWFESAFGARAFAAYAMAETYLELGLEDEALSRFLADQGRDLLRRRGTERRVSYQALAALALYTIYLVTDQERLRVASQELRDAVLASQGRGGGFQSSGQVDPQAHCSIVDHLAKLWQRTQDPTLFQALGEAVRYAARFKHPLGTRGPIYGARETFHFYLHGFELLSPFYQQAKDIAAVHRSQISWERPHRVEADQLVENDQSPRPFYAYNCLQAFRDGR